MRPNLIREHWLSYARDVIPADAPDIQINESRRAFYAGARAFFSCITGVLTEDCEPTPADLQAVTYLNEELEEFHNDVLAGRA